MMRKIEVEYFLWCINNPEDSIAAAHISTKPVTNGALNSLIEVYTKMEDMRTKALDLISKYEDIIDSSSSIEEAKDEIDLITTGEVEYFRDMKKWD